MGDIRQGIEQVQSLLGDILSNLDSEPFQPTGERVFKITFKDEPTTELVRWLQGIVYGVCDRLGIDERQDFGHGDLPQIIFNRIAALNEWAQLEEIYRKEDK